MSIKVLVELVIKKSKLHKIEDLFSNLLLDTRRREGNEGVTVISDQDDSTRVVLIEQWESRNHYDEYNEWRAERGDLQKLSQLLSIPPQRSFYSFIKV